MLERGKIFKAGNGKAEKFFCYLKDVDDELDYRKTGIAYEACSELVEGRRKCAACLENCQETKKYYIKAIDKQKLTEKRRQLGKQKFEHSEYYVYLCCHLKERDLVALLRDELIPAYLVPPQYIFNLPEGESRNAKITGTAYPYRGRSWQEVLRECRGIMKPEEFLLLKEKIIFQLLYAVKALHQLPGDLVHRDLKPSNITIEKTDGSYDDLLVSIIDWDWVCIKESADDPFADIAGGTSGFAHPNSLIRNQKGILSAIPSRRWDYYSAALTIFYIFEERYHFKENEAYWEDQRAFSLREMPKTKKYLDECCKDEAQSLECAQMLRRILQKMMGEDLEYRNQYQDIQEAVDDFEQYLYVRHGREFSQYFCSRYLLHNSDQRYCRDHLMQICCRYKNGVKSENFYYVLAERDAVTVELEGKKTVILCRCGTENLYGFLLSDDWNWSDSGKLTKDMKERERLSCRNGKEELEILYLAEGADDETDLF